MEVMTQALKIAKPDVSSDSTVVLIAVLVIWYLSSAIFNDTTPRLMKALQKIGGENIDVTVIEFAISIIIGCISLAIQRKRPLPSVQLMLPSLFIGSLHVVGCRLFLFGLQYIPVSLAQTIRASNPLITVVFSFAIFGFPLPNIMSLLSLIPVLAGFGLAIAADMTVEPVGVFASIGSVCCLVLVNGLSKRLFDDNSLNQVRPSGSELQCWTLQGAFLLLCLYWCHTGGHQRLFNIAQTAGSDFNTVLMLCMWDGVLYFTEQIAQFLAISMMDPLSLAVTDTTRRLFIVIVSGFVLQGNTPNFRNVVGALLVYFGAALYAVSVHPSSSAPTPQPRKPSKPKKEE
jgi:drug/metabolite transporter (DMT)-like permease